MQFAKDSGIKIGLNYFGLRTTLELGLLKTNNINYLGPALLQAQRYRGVYNSNFLFFPPLK